MIQPSFYHLKTEILVRMSKDDIIDQYDIFPIKIGEGNDAVVYKAKQNFENGQWRAVKKIHRKYIDKEEYLLTQINILKKLDHPGILRIYEIFDDQQYISLVTELCEGDSLYKALQSKNYYREQQAKQIFKRIIEIVSYCHKNKIIHRDLKPQNLVFADKQNTAQSLKLIDFGMSFQWQTHPRIQIKNTYSSNKVVGTIYYMAPQIHNQTYDERVDIWSAGVILYFLLTGELPFDQDEDESIQEAIRLRKVSYQKITKRKCTSKVKDLLTKIFQPQNKRINVDQIMMHPWMTSLKSVESQMQAQAKNIHYFSKIPFKQFQLFEQYMAYYQKAIKDLQINENIPIHYKCLNWNNVYQFIRFNSKEQALKVFQTYRMTQSQSKKYIKVFDFFKTKKKQQILIGTLYQQLKLQYQQLQIVISQQSPQNMSAYKQNCFSIRTIYTELLSFFKHFRHFYIGFTQFMSWISDKNQFYSSQIEFIKESLHKNIILDKKNDIQIEINQIHKIIRNKCIEKKRRSKTQYHFHSNLSPSINQHKNTKINNRKFPNFHVKIEDKNVNNNEQYEQQVNLRKNNKRTIKQNIFESFSPTFSKKLNQLNKDKVIQIKQKEINKIPLTQRAKGSRLLQKEGVNSGFIFGLQRIIQLW